MADSDPKNLFKLNLIDHVLQIIHLNIQGDHHMFVDMTGK